MGPVIVTDETLLKKKIQIEILLKPEYLVSDDSNNPSCKVYMFIYREIQSTTT